MTGGAAGILGITHALLSGDGNLLAQAKSEKKTFSHSALINWTKQLALQPYISPEQRTQQNLPALTYDEYRDIRFNPDRSIWRGEQLNAELQLFATGYLATTPVEIWLVHKGMAQRLTANQKDFSVGPLALKKAPNAPHGLSGFRIHGPINRSDYFDEHTVFQGASYFRAVARGQVYGLSARGLAINTARPQGEEFPVFKSFWIEKPNKGDDNVIVHALLDSPSVTGAYHFDIRPGIETIMQVSAQLFARKSIAHAGLAPLTSMFLFGPACRRIKNDFRPAVFDSEGLAIYNGRSERLWRPLTNPKTLQTSVFEDENPKGFGLIQRDRSFNSFQDLEANYERRPSLWVEPTGGWGKGHVELIEIPTNEEIHDNIVAYWKPTVSIEPGKPFQFAYRLRWTGMDPADNIPGRIAKTRVGVGAKPGTTKFVIDVTGPTIEQDKLPKADLSTPNAKLLAPVVVQKNPKIDGLRVSFDVATANLDVAELRLDLTADNRRVCETWLYRWTKS